MEREPAAPAGSTLFTFQDIAEYTGSLGGSRLRHHVRGKRSAVLSHECSIFVRGRAAPARDSRQDAPRPAPHMKGRKCVREWLSSLDMSKPGLVVVIREPDDTEIDPSGHS